MLSVKNINAFYGYAQVIYDVQLHVEHGEMVFVAGRNGAGKTTLMRTIAGFMEPQSGVIVFDGTEIGGVRPEKISLLGIRYVFQDKRVFSKLTVRENIELAAYPVKEKVDDAIGKILEIYPQMEKFLGSPAGSLSGGQRQILLIGRALIGNPKLLLIDEPTEGLAATTINDILNVLSNMKGRVSMVIVEQNLSVVGLLADRLYLMQEGKIVKELNDEEQIKNKTEIEKYL